MREKAGGPPPHRTRRRARRATFLFFWSILLPLLPARAEMIVQGSTTVAAKSPRLGPTARQRHAGTGSSR